MSTKRWLSGGAVPHSGETDSYLALLESVYALCGEANGGCLSCKLALKCRGLFDCGLPDCVTFSSTDAFTILQRHFDLLRISQLEVSNVKV